MSQISDNSQGKGIRQYFRTSSNSKVLYDWLDIISGVGYKRFYACASAISGTDLYFLTNQSNVDGSPTYKESSHDSTTYTLKADLDFDVTFKVPGVIGGTSIINVTNYLDDNNSRDYIKIYVYKVVGVTETQIGTATSVTRVDATGPEYYRECISVDLTETAIAVGEKLRLNVQQWCYVAISTMQFRIYFDPASGKTFTDTLGRTVGSDLTFDVPFKVEL